MDQYNISHIDLSTDFDNQKRHFSQSNIKGLGEPEGIQYTDQNSPSKECKNCDWNILIPRDNSVRLLLTSLIQESVSPASVSKISWLDTTETNRGSRESCER